MTGATWRRAIGALLIAAAGGWLGWQIARNWRELQAYEWQADPVLLAASVALHVATLAWGVWVWRRVVLGFAPSAPPLAALLRTWFLSNLAKYIPGKVFQFVAVVQMSERAGASPALLVLSLIAHSAVAMGAGLLVAAWTLGGVLLPGGSAPVAAVVLTVAAVAAAHPLALGRLINLALRHPSAARLGNVRWRGSWADGLVILGANVVSWFLTGAAFFLLVTALTPTGPEHLLTLTGINALSVVAGLFSLLPAGVGVREVAMTELLRGIVPAGVAAALAVVSRLWAIATDVSGGLVALALFRAGATPPVEVGDTPGPPPAE